MSEHNTTYAYLALEHLLDVVKDFRIKYFELKSINSDLLMALKGLTLIDTIRKGPLKGAIIIGPQGWEQAQLAIKNADRAHRKNNPTILVEE